MSSNKHKTNRESIEAAANELGISFEELLELKNEFKTFSDKVKKQNNIKSNRTSKAGKEAQSEIAKYRENNRAKFINDCKRGGKTTGKIHSEKFKSGDTKTLELVRKWRESGKCKGAKASAEAQIKSGRLGSNSEMSRYKKALNRIRWAKKLLPLKGLEFTSNEVVGKYITRKELSNIKHSSDLLIITNPGKRYSTFMINEKKVDYWANRPKPIIGEE